MRAILTGCRTLRHVGYIIQSTRGKRPTISLILSSSTTQESWVGRLARSKQDSSITKLTWVHIGLKATREAAVRTDSNPASGSRICRYPADVTLAQIGQAWKRSSCQDKSLALSRLPLLETLKQLHHLSAGQLSETLLLPSPGLDSARDNNSVRMPLWLVSVTPKRCKSQAPQPGVRSAISTRWGSQPHTTSSCSCTMRLKLLSAAMEHSQLAPRLNRSP